LNWLAESWLWLLAMGILMLMSAFFSGSEAALFSLNSHSRKKLARAGSAGRIATNLLRDPERLLSAILFWNLLVNMTYFAIAAIVAGKLESDDNTGSSLVVVFTTASLLALIFFSEMLPKSVAVLAALRISSFVGPPLLLAVKLVGPFLPFVTRANQIASRLIWPNLESEPEIDLRDIERAIELGTDDAVLLQRERMALRGLVEMSETRISELMRPRNRLWSSSSPLDRQQLLDELPPSGNLMVTSPSGEMIVQTVAVRSLRPNQLDDLSASCESVIYVPWSALVSQVLDQLQAEGRSVAVVVNEFGELAGAVTLDEILHFVLAPRSDEDFAGTWSVQELEKDHYRVSGSVSVRSLAKRLGIEVSGEGVITLSGYIQRQNGRFPKTGDVATLGRYQLTVTRQTDEGSEIDVVPHSSQEEG
jgi:CBS domain containing-hemolysin-like protein